MTSATPHLGARGHRLIPVLYGCHSLEKVALHTSGVPRRTGKHVFLRDNDNGKPSLLLQMTDDLKFTSALQSFTRREAYANTSFDRILRRGPVGSEYTLISVQVYEGLLLTPRFRQVIGLYHVIVLKLTALNSHGANAKQHIDTARSFTTLPSPSSRSSPLTYPATTVVVSVSRRRRRLSPSVQEQRG
ncbi:hypothetical protein AAHA92_24649 [Salvia divinorum]|uniref:DUF676 domain-containing protein n=1 Tax=Salvia divinorum TaxID=28513 RepID=A0ABD1G816_SALDI